MSVGPALPPLVDADAGILKTGAVGVQGLEMGSEDTDELGREIQRLPELHLTRAQRLRHFLVLGHIYPGPDKLDHTAVGRRRADAPHIANRSVWTHDPLGEVESAKLGQHRLDLLPDEFPIVRMYQRDVILCARRRTCWIQAMNRKQLRRPVLEAGRGKGPASRVREALSVCQIKLGLLALVDVEVDSDPAEERSVAPSKPFRATQEPAVIALAITDANTHLTRATDLQIL